jgi:hypothetical protein
MKSNKYDTATPRSVVQKDLKRCRTWLIVCAVLAVLCFGGGAWPAGVIVAVMSVALYLRAKPDAQLLADIDAAAAAAAIAEQEAAERQAAFDARWQAMKEEEAAFLAAHDLVKEVRTKVVGVTFTNDDGERRQDIIADRCYASDQVALREFTYEGAPAYAVYVRGEQIGNLPADLAQDLHDLPDDYVIDGYITEVTGGDGRKYGVNLRLPIYRRK